jgi:hypothetical protein
VTSLIVGDEIFIVNCWPLAAVANAQDSSKAAAMRMKFAIVTPQDTFVARVLRLLA